MRHKAILENGGMLKSIPNQCKSQVMCDKIVDNIMHMH